MFICYCVTYPEDYSTTSFICSLFVEWRLKAR